MSDPVDWSQPWQTLVQLCVVAASRALTTSGPLAEESAPAAEATSSSALSAVDAETTDGIAVQPAVEAANSGASSSVAPLADDAEMEVVEEEYQEEEEVDADVVSNRQRWQRDHGGRKRKRGGRNLEWHSRWRFDPRNR